MVDKLLIRAIAKMNTTGAETFGVTHFATCNTEVSPNVKSLLRVPLFTLPFKMMHV